MSTSPGWRRSGGRPRRPGWAMPTSRRMKETAATASAAPGGRATGGRGAQVVGSRWSGAGVAGAAVDGVASPGGLAVTRAAGHGDAGDQEGGGEGSDRAHAVHLHGLRDDGDSPTPSRSPNPITTPDR